MVCNSCGADVRKGSIFCFSCGKSVKNRAKNAQAVPPKINNGSLPQEAIDEKVEVPGKLGENVVAKNELERRVSGETKPDLRSAASLRKKVKAYNRKPVEVVWTERERFPTAYFIASVILVLFSAAMLILAWYLK